MKATTTNASYAVIGGEGFVGAALVTALLDRYSSSSTASLGLTQRYFPAQPTSYSFHRSDITSLPSVLAALSACIPIPTVVFHTASPHPGSTEKTCEAVNVEGTRNVLEACRILGINVLVFTSSMTVCYEGNDLKGADERLGVVSGDGDDYYVNSKVKAERLVLEANDPNGLLTCSLRLAGIIGPGDRQVLPGMIKVLHDHQSAFQIGDNLTLLDFVHIKNVVHAHLLAAEKLSALSSASSTSSILRPTISSSPSSNFDHLIPFVDLTNPRRPLPTSDRTDIALPSSRSDPPIPIHLNFLSPLPPYSAATPIAGQAFFITNGEPVAFWSFTRAVWFAYNGHVPKFTIVIPRSVAMILAAVSDVYGSMMGVEMAFSKSNVRYVTCDLYFGIEKARRVLGYEPIVSLEDGIKDAVEWYKEDERSQRKTQEAAQSKSS